jgi:hypothetical protein
VCPFQFGKGRHFLEENAAYSIFGNTVDRKHRFKSARPQGATTRRESPKGYTISENAVALAIPAYSNSGTAVVRCAHAAIRALPKGL